MNNIPPPPPHPPGYVDLVQLPCVRRGNKIGRLLERGPANSRILVQSQHGYQVVYWSNDKFQPTDSPECPVGFELILGGKRTRRNRSRARRTRRAHRKH